jgi:hypothetical protein
MSSPITDCLGSGDGVFLLPAGYVDEDGLLHREVDLAQLTGFEEEYLASVSPTLPTAAVVTQLLARCVRRIGNLATVDTALIRTLVVGDREYLVLRLWQLTNGNKLRVMLPCQSEECGKNMQIDFSLAEIPVRGQPLTSRTFTLEVEDGGTLEFRLPTGEDQEALAEHMDDADCVEQLLRRCIVRMPTTLDLQKVRPAIEKRMEELTPRPVLEVEGVCPECGLQFSSTLDLSELVLAEAVEQSKRLPYDVHRLAWHYHWPEGEILSLPRRKRFRYLNLLEDELERMNLT